MKKYGVLLLLVASTGCWAQKDTMNTISIGLELVTHGETCHPACSRQDGNYGVKELKELRS